MRVSYDMERDSKSRVNPSRSLVRGDKEASPCVQSKKMIASSKDNQLRDKDIVQLDVAMVVPKAVKQHADFTWIVYPGRIKG